MGCLWATSRQKARPLSVPPRKGPASTDKEQMLSPSQNHTTLRSTSATPHSLASLILSICRIIQRLPEPYYLGRNFVPPLAFAGEHISLTTKSTAEQPASLPTNSCTTPLPLHALAHIHLPRLQPTKHNGSPMPPVAGCLFVHPTVCRIRLRGLRTRSCPAWTQHYPIVAFSIRPSQELAPGEPSPTHCCHNTRACVLSITQAPVGPATPLWGSDCCIALRGTAPDRAACRQVERTFDH